MTQGEIILAQQARIEQLKHALSVGWSPYYINGIDARKLADEALATPDDLSALREHDAALWREAAEYCKQQADEWDSDRVLTFKNYAGNCADELNARAEAIEKGGV